MSNWFTSVLERAEDLLDAVDDQATEVVGDALNKATGGRLGASAEDADDDFTAIAREHERGEVDVGDVTGFEEADDFAGGGGVGGSGVGKAGDGGELSNIAEGEDEKGVAEGWEDDDDVDDDDVGDDDDVNGSQPSGKGFTKPAITRLARRAGVKSMSDDCIIPLKHLVAMKLDELLSTTLIVNSQHATKTIMPDDVYEALSLCGINVARTEEF